MYLLDSQNHGLAGSELMSPSGSPTSINQTNSTIAALLSEERPIDMLTLLSILVLLLHVWLLTWLLRPVEQLTPAQPLMMEVSMLAVSAPKPAVAAPTAKRPAISTPNSLPKPIFAPITPTTPSPTIRR